MCITFDFGFCYGRMILLVDHLKACSLPCCKPVVVTPFQNTSTSEPIHAPLKLVLENKNVAEYCICLRFDLVLYVYNANCFSYTSSQRQLLTRETRNLAMGVQEQESCLPSVTNSFLSFSSDSRILSSRLMNTKSMSRRTILDTALTPSQQCERAELLVPHSSSTQAAECILHVVERSNAPVIYLSTDAAGSETDLLQSLAVLNDKTIPLIKRPGRNFAEKWDALLYRNHFDADSQVESMLDKTICAMPSVFIGSSGSTFRDDIF